MLYKCLKDKSPAVMLGVGNVLLFTSIIILATVFKGDSFGFQIHSPVSFLSDSFVNGLLTGFFAVLFVFSIILNVKGMQKLKKIKEEDK